jgi:hypothetical protein
MFNGVGDRGPDPPRPFGGNPAAHNLDPRRRAREESKVKQILVDFTELQEREKM